MKSTIDLLVLGILTETSMNAYELAKFIGDRQVGSFLKVSDPAVYKCCKRLFQQGYLDGNSVREGNHPSKTIYNINADGVEKFNELMMFYSSDLPQWNIEFNAFIWHLEKLEKKQGLKMLLELRDSLKEKGISLNKHLSDLTPYLPFSARMILKQHTMTITTLIAWLDETIEAYKKIKSPKQEKYDVSAVLKVHDT